MRFPIIVCLAAALTACSVKVPVAVVGNNGEVMHGTATATPSAGVFEVSGPFNGKQLTCNGTYDPFDRSPQITIPTTCSDGRTGTVVANRDASGMNGNGTVTLNDGATAIFVFGADAEAY